MEGRRQATFHALALYSKIAGARRRSVRYVIDALHRCVPVCAPTTKVQWASVRRRRAEGLAAARQSPIRALAGTLNPFSVIDIRLKRRTK
jgi:hypothetical protein